MPNIEFQNGKPGIVVESGANLMRTLQKNGVPVASSCGGEGVCLKCIVEVTEGASNLSPETEFEKDLRDIHDIPRSHRISCQAKVLGDIKITTEYW